MTSADPTPVGATLVDSAGRPAITITPYTGDPAAALQPIALGDEARQTILAVLRAAPGVALAVSVGGGGTYALRFAPHVAAQLASGQASLMSAVNGGVRAIAVNGQGRIVAHGTLVPLTGVSPALAALGVWQALAVITAQHYLVDIQRQLRQIASAVAALRQWHEDRELGQIVSDHAYLERTRDLLLNAPLRDVERGAIIGQLDQIERQAGVIVAARQQSLARAAEQARTLPLGSPFWWEVERNAGQLTTLIHNAATDMQMTGLALGLQAAVAQTQSALLGRTRKGADLLATVVTSARNVRTQWDAIATTVHARIPEIASVSDLRRVARNLQSLAALEIDAASALLVPAFVSLETADAQPQSQPPPLQIAVQPTPDGDVRAYLVGKADAPPPPPTPPDLATHRAVRRLSAVSGITLANFDDLPHARERFRLSDDTSVLDFTNFVGFHHVYLVDPSGKCRFGGFVPPTHATYLRQALAEIRTSAGG